MRHLLIGGRTPLALRHPSVGALALLADSLQQLAVGGEFVELVVMLVAQPDAVLAVLRHNADCVRELEQPGTPRRQEFAIAVKDYDRVLRVAVKAVDPVLRVDRHRAGLDLQPLRRLLPFLVDPVRILATADDRFHCASSRSSVLYTDACNSLAQPPPRERG